MHLCHFTNRRWDALQWERNLFESTALGLLLFVIARLWVPWWLTYSNPLAVARTLRHALPFPYARSLLLTLCIGVGAGFLGRLAFSDKSSLRAVVERFGGELLKILADAGERRVPLMLTLANRKVYVGLVLSWPSLSTSEKYVRILPTISGYREDGSLGVKFTTVYSDVYDDLKKRGEKVPFGVVIPLDQVSSVSLFDIKVYMRYFESVGAPQGLAVAP